MILFIYDIDIVYDNIVYLLIYEKYIFQVVL